MPLRPLANEQHLNQLPGWFPPIHPIMISLRLSANKCLVTDVDIPYDYRDKNVSMDHVMKIKKLEQYPADFLTADRLKEYGVNAVRGPRHMPADLVHMLNSLSK